MTHLLFNIHVYDLHFITSKKYRYTNTDDSAILYSFGDCKVLQRTLSEGMTTLSAYLQTWRIKLNHAKTVTVAFRRHNREAKLELKVKNNGKFLPFCQMPTYLGVKFDRALTYSRHLEALRKILFTRVSLLRRLAGLGWGAGAKTLRTAALSLIYSIAEYGTVHQVGVAARILVSFTAFLMTFWELSLDVYVPLQRTTFQFSQTSSQLNFGAKERHSPRLMAVLWTLATFCIAS